MHGIFICIFSWLILIIVCILHGTFLFMEYTSSDAAFVFQQVLQNIVDTITPDDIRILTESIDEDSRKGGFIRVFPTPSTKKYLRFFEQPRYYNLLLDQWVTRYNRMEQRGESPMATTGGHMMCLHCINCHWIHRRYLSCLSVVLVVCVITCQMTQADRSIFRCGLFSGP